MIRTVASNIVTAVLVSAFWIIAYNMIGNGGGVDAAGDKQVVRTDANGRITMANGVVVGPSGLAIPVAGVKAGQLVDTFTQARAGGARVHDAIDIMAPEGTAVLAAAPGMVEKLFFSAGGGGISAYIRSNDRRWIYYYAHLRDYAPGMREGQAVPRGALIGYVGYTGNASPGSPHLHFAINAMQPGEKWHQGTPINPYPLLAGEPASR
ncbi:M23 family metallopeptidase [Sphingomonas sp.]|uniref:M23 family metallopeptidase n=1 Tax=Sphingomonas sp. TaxID=28214 RepID=UPI00286B9C4F|nr:M23 family metallopeptidase [Sphingomonas sp.]